MNYEYQCKNCESKVILSRKVKDRHNEIICSICKNKCELLISSCAFIGCDGMYAIDQREKEEKE